MLKKVLCIAAALCGFTGLAQGALTYTQTPALFLGGGDASKSGNDLRVATNTAGLTVVAWSAPAFKDPQFSNIINSIFIQRYDANGNPLGSLVRIDPTKSCKACGYNYLIQPVAAIDPLGRFVVAWVGGDSWWVRLYDEQGKLTKEKELLTNGEVGWYPSADLRMDAIDMALK